MTWPDELVEKAQEALYETGWPYDHLAYPPDPKMVARAVLAVVAEHLGAKVEFGWTARFANGEEFDRHGGLSREEADFQAREYQAEEDRGAKELTYTVQQRLTFAGPWSPVVNGQEGE